jgi:hypothetical protein
MRQRRFLGMSIMILAAILFVLQAFVSYGPKSPGERSGNGPPTAINRAPSEASQRTNPTALIVSGILLVIGGGLYYSGAKRGYPLAAQNRTGSPGDQS